MSGRPLFSHKTHTKKLYLIGIQPPTPPKIVPKRIPISASNEAGMFKGAFRCHLDLKQKV
jgi:hypothetical protein